MLISLFYTLNVLILLSGLSGFRQASGERRFSLALIQSLMGLPLLACEYFYLAYHMESSAVKVVLFSEIVFAVIWLSLALRMRQANQTSIRDFRAHFLVEIVFAAVLMIIAAYFLVSRSLVEISDLNLCFPIYNLVYLSTLLVLIIVLYFSWRLEEFWRSLDGARRWEYKILLVGGYLVCGSLAWSCSYRLTYLTIYPKHLLLLSVLLFSGWAMMAYAVVRHRLLNRKIFISRKIVYAFVVPTLLVTYLLSFGVISLIMNIFGMEMVFVLKWLSLVLGLIAVGLFASSGRIRRRIHFFISTHFYINKYEYRDEWLALSHQLQGALSETEVVKALRKVLAESLYTTEIFIWLGWADSSSGFKLVSSSGDSDIVNRKNNILSDDPLVSHLKTHSCFHVKEKEPDSSWREVIKTKESYLRSLNLTLLAPISIGNQLVGLIGLGPEFTGGEYGHDDFDLLTALGSQTASAILVVRMAEELANAREQQAWHRLSAFVLHDIKNAATMLSLLQENAPEHIHEPEFQKDMLELVDDALRRMGRVEQQLSALQEEISPTWKKVELGTFLHDYCHLMGKKLPVKNIIVQCPEKVWIKTDPALLSSLIENLLLNSFEAGGKATVVQIKAYVVEDAEAVIELLDNGPGIEEALLPDILFEAFKTSKEGGSGIGLWQVKKVVKSLNGSISAENTQEGGARFTVKLSLGECQDI